MIEAALQWAFEGVPVFPVSGKVPRTEHGLKDASTDEAQICGWWTAWPDAGIGGAVGETCGLWVLDVDGPEGLASLRQLEREHGALPPTRTVRTGGGGLHLWFRMPASGRPVGNRARVKPGIDVRGTGGYVVLPPSPHPSGQPYRLEDDTAPAEAPLWLIDLVVSKAKRERPAERVVSVSPGAGGSVERRRVLGMVAAAAERIRATPEGERNDTVNRECYGVGGFLDGAGLTVGEVAGLLEAAAEAAQQDPAMVRRALEDGRAEPRALPEDTPRPTRWERVTARAEGQTEADEERPEPDVWEQLARSKGTEDAPGRPRPTLRNVVVVLAYDSRWKGRIRSDVLRDQLVIDGVVVTDGKEVEIACWLDRVYGIETGPDRVHQAIGALAERAPYSPVVEYLDGLTWDGVPRLDGWLVRYAGVDASADGLDEVYGARWAISAVARAYEPGCQADSVLILSGPKGIGKTSTLRVLAGADWYSESPLPIGTDEAPKKLAGVWVYELGELASLKRAAIEGVKQFITATVDRFRPSYGRNQVVRQRRCIFAGTTNEDAFLVEDDRRWWVRRVAREADLAALARDRDQLWAEAVHRYRAGERWHLDRELSALQGVDVEQYRHADPWEHAIAKWSDGRSAVTTDQVLVECLKKPLGDVSKADEMRVGSILKRLGRVRVRATVDGRRVYQWKT